MQHALGVAVIFFFGGIAIRLVRPRQNSGRLAGVRIGLLTSIKPRNGNLCDLNLCFHSNTERRLGDLLHSILNRDFMDAYLSGGKDGRVTLCYFSHRKLNSLSRGEDNEHDTDGVPLCCLGGVNNNGSLLIDGNSYRNKIFPIQIIYMYKYTQEYY